MAKLFQAFDAKQYDPTQSTGQLPIGRHLVTIESSDVKENSNKNGGYLQLNLSVVEGPNAGASGAMRFNLYHENQTTVDIAHKQLSAVCHVTGVYNLQDSAQLHSQRMMVDVAAQKNDPKYTEVKKVYDVNGNEPGQQGQQSAQAAPAEQTGWGSDDGERVVAEQPATPQQPAWGGEQPSLAPSTEQEAPAQSSVPPWAQPKQ